MDPRKLRKTARDGMWVMAGAFIVFPLVAALFLGFDSGDVALIILGVFFFIAGIFAGKTGLA